jgi:hypothetical protein
MSLPVIEVTKIEELGDGTAKVELDLDTEAIALLIQIGFNKILADYVFEKETEKDA